MAQHAIDATRNMLVEGNVFFDWKLPFRDSFGLSIVADESVTHADRQQLRPRRSHGRVERGERKPTARASSFGYGIEAGFSSGVVEGNVVGGPWANHIVASHKDTPVRNNKLYGEPGVEETHCHRTGPGRHGLASSRRTT